MTSICESQGGWRGLPSSRATGMQLKYQQDCQQVPLLSCMRVTLCEYVFTIPGPVHGFALEGPLGGKCSTVDIYHLLDCTSKMQLLT